MTVSELIKELESFDLDMRACYIINGMLYQIQEVNLQKNMDDGKAVCVVV